MANTIIVQNAKIWRNDFEDGFSYSISLSSKNQDGNWDRAYLPIKIAKSCEAPAKISNGTVADIEGFLTPKVKKDGRNEVQMIVMKFNAKDEEKELPAHNDLPDSFEQATEDIPF